jgi:hypothetical protein
MAVQNPVLSTNDSLPYGGRKRTTVTWNLASGDTMANYSCPNWASEVHLQFIPAGGSSGVFSLSYEDPTQAPTGFANWAPGVVSVTTLLSTQVPNYLSGACTVAGTGKFVAVFVGS